MAQLVKTIGGLAIASVKTVNGLAIASVKTIMGLDNTAAGGGLVDTGLQVRYFLDEAASGTSPTTVADAGPATTLPLTINYGAGDTDLEWAEPASNQRGLEFKDDAGNQRASYDIPGSGDKISDNIIGADKITFEIVFSTTGVSTSTGRLFVINGDLGENARFGLTGNSFAIHFNWNGSVVRSWTVTTGVRSVWHIVIDTTQATANDRVKVYKDGSIFSPTIDSNMAQNNTLSDNSEDIWLNIGNRESSGSFARSLNGIIQYAALYSGVFTAANVTTNFDILTDDDDSP